MTRSSKRVALDFNSSITKIPLKTVPEWTENVFQIRSSSGFFFDIDDASFKPIQLTVPWWHFVPSSSESSPCKKTQPSSHHPPSDSLLTPRETELCSRRTAARHLVWKPNELLMVGSFSSNLPGFHTVYTGFFLRCWRWDDGIQVFVILFFYTIQSTKKGVVAFTIGYIRFILVSEFEPPSGVARHVPSGCCYWSIVLLWVPRFGFKCLVGGYRLLRVFSMNKNIGV